MKGLVWAVFLFGVGGLAQLGASPTAPQAKDDINATGGQVRTYYVAAEEVEWDYAPLGINMNTGKPFEGTAAAYNPGPDRVLKTKAIPNIPETQRYVRRVLTMYRHYRRTE